MVDHGKNHTQSRYGFENKYLRRMLVLHGSKAAQNLVETHRAQSNQLNVGLWDAAHSQYHLRRSLYKLPRFGRTTTTKLLGRTHPRRRPFHGRISLVVAHTWLLLFPHTLFPQCPRRPFTGSFGKSVECI